MWLFRRIRVEFEKGRVNVHNGSDGIPYSGNIGNYGVRNPVCSVISRIGVLKMIREKTGEHDGAAIHAVMKGEKSEYVEMSEMRSDFQT